MKNHEANPIEVLFIENVPQNIDLITQMLNKTKSQYTLHIANGITESLDYMKKKGNKNNKKKPDMIFCNADLFLNFENDIIQKVTGNGGFSHTPVLFIKITNRKIKIIKAIDKYINYQSTQMRDIDYFVETIISLKKFMTSLVKLPELAA